NQSAQKNLWLVPSIDTTTSPAELVKNARIIKNVLQELMSCLPSSAEEFFIEHDISFANKKNHGIGDLDLQGFVQWIPQREYLIEGFLGISIPTGKRANKPNQSFLQPLGNNGHWEVKFGSYVHLQPCDWFSFDCDSSYAHVLKRREKLPRAFVGATVKNIGLPTNATVSWGYYVGHADLIFTAPCLSRHHTVQLQCGYELYHKQKD